MEISVVIPTRNRPEQIRKVLATLAAQSLQASEIIIVDASDDALKISNELSSQYDSLPLKWLLSEPSVCIQRNTGINAARHDWVFLCDDDIALPSNHFESLAAYARQHPSCGALAGRLRQLEHDVWVDQYPPKNLTSLFYLFIFQLSVWGSLEEIKTKRFSKPLLLALQRWYRKRGNRESLAGWPLITQWENHFTTRFYSLGANLVRRSWLKESPYDPVLDRGGIGDNYGVALGFPGEIHVIDTTHALHYRAQSNRVNRTLAYYRRVLALHYFVKTQYLKDTRTTRWLCWSLIGLSMQQFLRFDFHTLRFSFKALFQIISGNNPYIKAKAKGETLITPT